MKFEGGILPLAEVRPWWLRLALLVAIASPLLMGGELHASLHLEHAYRDLAEWVAYSMFIWLFTGLCVGLRRLLGWIGGGALFGLTLAFGGAFFSKLGIWRVLGAMVGSSDTESAVGQAQHELDLIFRVVMIMTTLPFFMLTLQSFSAVGLFNRAIRWGTRRRTAALVAMAVFLRAFQHVAEIFDNLLLAWHEENPMVIIPRHRRDAQASFIGRAKWFSWALASVRVWCQALLIHSLLFVPVVVREWQQFLDQRWEHE